jgi:hypothetical protein
MDKHLVGLIGTVGALLAFAPAQASTAHALAGEAEIQASSYAGLLQPIPNALALLKVSDAAAARIASEAPVPESQATVQEAQLTINLGGKHRSRRRHHHHHHHHHHQT